MKNKKKTYFYKFIKCASLFLLIAIVGIAVNVKEVKAGFSDVVVDNTSFAEELDTSKWNVPGADVYVQDGKIVFPTDSTGNTRLIAKRAMKRSTQHAELFDVDCEICIKNIPEGEKFIFALGLDGSEACYGEAGNMEIFFENAGGLKAGIRFYDENGNENILVESQSTGAAFDKAFRIKINVTADMKLDVKVNGKPLYNGETQVEMEGRVGFLQTASCHAEISSVNIVSHTYDTPENINITEDFESGSINTNALTSLMLNSCLYYPAGVAVEDYEGSQVLRFRNANLAYFGTRYQYSNFEMTFDIPYMLHSNITREDGSLQTPSHLKFMVAFGDESQDYDSYGYVTAAEGIGFGSNDISSLKENFETVYFDGTDFYDKDSNEGYSVRITVIDTIVTVWIKPLSAADYTEMVSYKIGNATPLGYIHIWSTGQANFAIDNFCLTNKDEGAKLTEVTYQAKVLEDIADWNYEPVDAPYYEVAEEKNITSLISPMLLVYVSLAGAAFILFSIFIAKLRRTPKKEGKK